MSHPQGASARRERIGSTPIAFHPESAHSYDARNLPFAVDTRTISLTPGTTTGQGNANERKKAA